MIGAVSRNHGANLTCLMAIAPAGEREPPVLEGAVDGPMLQ